MISPGETVRDSLWGFIENGIFRERGGNFDKGCFYNISRRDGKGFLMGFYREWNIIERGGYNQGIPYT